MVGEGFAFLEAETFARVVVARGVAALSVARGVIGRINVGVADEAVELLQALKLKSTSAIAPRGNNLPNPFNFC